MTDAAWGEVRALLSDRDLIELVMLAAHHEMPATVIGTLRTQPDRMPG